MALRSIDHRARLFPAPEPDHTGSDHSGRGSRGFLRGKLDRLECVFIGCDCIARILLEHRQAVMSLEAIGAIFDRSLIMPPRSLEVSLNKRRRADSCLPNFRLGRTGGFFPEAA